MEKKSEFLNSSDNKERNLLAQWCHEQCSHLCEASRISGALYHRVATYSVRLGSPVSASMPICVRDRASPKSQIFIKHSLSNKILEGCNEQNIEASCLPWKDVHILMNFIEEINYYISSSGSFGLKFIDNLHFNIVFFIHIDWTLYILSKTKKLVNRNMRERLNW